MSPEELADRHPRIYHVTDPSNLPGIRRHGLLPTSQLPTLFEDSVDDRQVIELLRRPKSVRLTHQLHGEVVITDNFPLNEAKLRQCLDDALLPSDWLAILNERVFFWADKESVDELLNAKLNRVRDRLVLVFDTLSVARRHHQQMEISAINTGSTLYNPARRGRSTFVPLLQYDFPTWQRLRGKKRPDQIREITVVGGVPHVADLIIDRFLRQGTTYT